MTEQKRQEFATGWLASFTIFEGNEGDLEAIFFKMKKMLEAKK